MCHADLSLRQAALIAGISLLIMMFIGPFANFYVLESLIVPGNAAATAESILANEALYRTGVFSLIVVIVLDVLVAWALYVFLRPVNESISLLAGWFRVVFATIFGISLSFLFSALLLLNGTDFLEVFEIEQVRAQVILLINTFRFGEQIAYTFFSLHLLVLGYLVFKLDNRGIFVRILGVLLFIAGLGYLMDSIGELLIPGYDANIAMYTFIGEVLLMLWLLFRGGRKTSEAD